MRSARPPDTGLLFAGGSNQTLTLCPLARELTCPADGFALLRKTAAVRDSDMAWIIRENLKKKRLSDAFPKEVQQVSQILEESNAR